MLLTTTNKMSNLCRDDFDSGPKHVFSIEDGLWLGNNKFIRHKKSNLESDKYFM